MIANIGRILDGFDCHNPGRIIDLRKFSLSDTFSFLVNGLFVILQAARFIDFNTIGIFIHYRDRRGDIGDVPVFNSISIRI